MGLRNVFKREKHQRMPGRIQYVPAAVQNAPAGQTINLSTGEVFCRETVYSGVNAPKRPQYIGKTVNLTTGERFRFAESDR